MTEHETGQPIARCQASEVEAWGYPFYVRLATGFEPPFLFLEDHLYNMEEAERALLGTLERIASEEDLLRLGYAPGDDGVYLL